MPIYEYQCLKCHKRFTVFLLNIVGQDEVPRCPRCGSTQVQKKFSRVALLRSEDDRIERTLSDFEVFGDLDEADPRTLGRAMRKMKDALGDEFADEIGPEFDEVVDRLEAGQSPEEIEEAMPELGTGESEEDSGSSDFDDWAD